MSAMPLTMYGMRVSGHAARTRSYFIKAGIPFCERAPSTAHYLGTVVPLAGGKSTMPTIEFPDGRVIRDSAAIVDHFEAETGHRFSPATPKQRIVSRLVDLFGQEGMLRPGMHYRWNFDAENLAYLESQTRRILPAGVDTDAMIRLAHDRTRSATRRFGVNPDTRDAVESLFADQLAAFDRHFAHCPYLLGGRPCIGDFGLMIMLHPHLGRDPMPLSLMHANGMAVLRWTERMNQHGADFTEFEGWDEAYLPDDEIPDTLIDLLRVMAEDFVPETLAAAEAINAWIEAQDTLEAGTPFERGVGFGEFELRGRTISALAQPYRFWRLKFVQDEYAALSAEDRGTVDALLEACGMAPSLGPRLTREIGRRDNLEVWL